MKPINPIFMKSLNSALLVISFFLFFKSFSQLPQNVNYSWGSSIQGATSGSGSEDWIYGLKTLNNGDYIVTGYVRYLVGTTYIKNPIAMLVSASGAKIWEQSYQCISGQGQDVYDHPLGYVIIGRGTSAASGCSGPPSMFSILVDKTTGAIIQSWGIKFYNEQTIPSFPIAQNGLTTTSINEYNNGKPRSCEIKNGNGQVTGYMICGNYNDNSFPNNAMTLTHFTTGCFLLKIDYYGRPDATFGNGGLKTYFENTSQKNFNPHLFNVCVNYDGSGNPQGFVAVGDVNENLPVLPPLGGSFNRDAVVFMTDMVGNIYYTDIYDESTHLKNTPTPASYPYTDTPDNPICPQGLIYPGQENANEKATRVRQKFNGGPFIVLNQFDYTFYGMPSSFSCSNIYPPTNGFFLASDPSVMEIDPSGNIIWTKNVFQSTGRDYENDLLVGTNNILVLGMTLMEPFPGTPTYMQAIVSKLDFAGNLLYDNVYTDNTSSQARFCPFDFDFDNGGGIIIGGDNDLNADDYQLINFAPY